jgi:hypothetical protein
MSTILATLKHSKKSAHQIHLPLSPVFHFPLELLVDLLKKKKKKKSLVYVGKGLRTPNLKIEMLPNNPQIKQTTHELPPKKNKKK